MKVEFEKLLGAIGDLEGERQVGGWVGMQMFAARSFYNFLLAPNPGSLWFF